MPDPTDPDALEELRHLGLVGELPPLRYLAVETSQGVHRYDLNNPVAARLLELLELHAGDLDVAKADLDAELEEWRQGLEGAIDEERYPLGAVLAVELLATVLGTIVGGLIFRSLPAAIATGVGSGIAGILVAGWAAGR